MKKLHPVLVGKTKETVSRLSGGPQPSKTEKRKEFLQRSKEEYVKLTPKEKKQGEKTGLLKYKLRDPNATIAYKKELNVGGTVKNIVGASRKESGFGRAKRVKLAASVTDKTAKQVRDISPTKAGKIIRGTKKGIKEAFKAGAEVCSAAVTGAGGSVKACAKRQGKSNF